MCICFAFMGHPAPLPTANALMFGWQSTSPNERSRTGTGVEWSGEKLKCRSFGRAYGKRHKIVQLMMITRRDMQSGVKWSGVEWSGLSQSTRTPEHSVSSCEYRISICCTIFVHSSIPVLKSRNWSSLDFVKYFRTVNIPHLMVGYQSMRMFHVPPYST